ncbi:MAG TPA: hypothetical protein VLX90_12140 [Steroidobacteraceae bacterium]|nr:hypothetical protein [Steroidobacteraceae bacterium]
MRTELQRLVAELPGAGIARAGRLGLELTPHIERDAWRRLVAHLAHLAHTTTGARQTITAWLGDALAYGEASYRGRIVTCAGEAGLEAGTLRNAKMVCSRIPVSCRHDGLSWTHHCEVGLAFADSTEIERWLALAERDKLSTRDLRKRIRAHVAHRREDRDAAPGSGSVETFQLLRELRAACRMLEQHRSVWRRWPPQTAGMALREAQPLADFIDRLRARALENIAGPPRDIQAN